LSVDRNRDGSSGLAKIAGQSREPGGKELMGKQKKRLRASAMLKKGTGR